MTGNAVELTISYLCITKAAGQPVYAPMRVSRLVSESQERSSDFIFRIVIFAEGTEVVLAGPSVNGQVAARNIGVAQEALFPGN